jgi:hypothetical protein
MNQSSFLFSVTPQTVRVFVHLTYWPSLYVPGTDLGYASLRLLLGTMVVRSSELTVRVSHGMCATTGNNWILIPDPTSATTVCSVVGQTAPFVFGVELFQLWIVK